MSVQHHTTSVFTCDRCGATCKVFTGDKSTTRGLVGWLYLRATALPTTGGDVKELHLCPACTGLLAPKEGDT